MCYVPKSKTELIDIYIAIGERKNQQFYINKTEKIMTTECIVFLLHRGLVVRIVDTFQGGKE